ncbi:MAG: hypothetical protein AMJ79_05260 [Phycisphaerae bacterium SM23_30]|nr:MAG: hypothetical protein AMJ79_05260 [Phycisphaerae bacterium SM23_30]
MSSFGSYESVREFYREGFKSASTARAGGRTAEEFVVKQWQSVAALFDPQQIQSAQEAFLDSARVQKQAAGGRFWAPIHQADKTDDGAYYVTDYYPRSLEQPIQGRVKLDARTLHAILSAVVQGLIELQTTCDRPHGNLKPTNVLLGEESIPAHLRVVLTDPLPTARLDVQQGKIDDFHALGELIHQLILHRSFQVLGGWPIAEGPEWRHLGKQSQLWLDLCNRLLNPNLDPGALTLEDVARQLADLQPPERNLARWGVIAGMVLLIAVGAVLIWRLFKPPPPAPLKNIEIEQWQTLCRDFENWLTFFYYQESLDTLLSSEDIQILRRDTYLAEHLFEISEKAAAKNIELDPLQITRRSGYTYHWLAQQELAVILDEKQSGQAYNAFGFVKEIKDGLRLRRIEVGPYASAWDTLDSICRAEIDFRERNWNAQKDVLQVLERISPILQKIDAQESQRPGELLGTLVYVVKEARKVNDVQQRWERILQPPTELLTEEQSQTMQNLRQDIRQAEIIVLSDKIAALQRYLIGITEQPAEWFRAVTGYTLGSIMLNEEWLNRRNTLLQNVTAAQLEDQNNYELYLGLRKKVNGVREFLEQLNDDSRLPGGAADYFASFSAKTWFDRDFWKDRLDAQREQTIKQLLTLVAWEDNIPQIDLEQFKQQDDFAKISGTYQRYYDQVRELTLAFGRMEEGLDLAYTLDETPLQADQPIRELFRTHTEQSFQPIYTAFRDRLTSVTRRIEQMLKVESGLDKAILIEQILQAETVELARAAWGKLREDPQWPLAAERPRQQEIIASLDERYQVFEKEHTDRWQQLQAELAQAAVSDSGKIVAQHRQQVEQHLINARQQIDPQIDTLGNAFLAAFDARANRLEEIDRWNDPQLNQIEQSARRLEELLAGRWQNLTKNIADTAQAYNALRNPLGYQKLNIADKLHQAEEQLARLDQDQLFRLIDQDLQEQPDNPYELLGKELQNEFQILTAVIELEDSIAAQARTIAESQDPVLVRFNELADAETQDLPKLPQRQVKLETIETLSRRLAAFVADDWLNKVDRDTFAQRENPVLLAAGEPPSIEIYESWLDEVQPYYLLQPDPRLEWPGMIATIEDAKDDITPVQERDLFAQKWQADLIVISAAQDIAGIVKNQTQIEQADALLREDHNKIRPSPEVIQAFAEALDTAEGIPDMFRQSVWPAVKESIKDIPEDSTFWALRDKVEKFQNQLQSLAGQLQPLPLPPADGRPWVDELINTQKNAHAEAAQTIIKLINQSGNISRGDYPDLEGEGFHSEKNIILSKYQQWKALPRVVEDLTELEGFLDRGYTLKGELSGAQKIENLLNQLNDVPLFAQVPQKTNPVLLRVDRLETLPNASQRDQLTARVKAIAEDENPEIIVTLWSRLGDLDDWPGSLQELDQEHGLHRELTRIAEGIRPLDADQADVISNRLTGQGPRRWRIGLQQLTAPQDREHAFDLRTDFQVDVTQLDQPLQEQLYRHELRRWLSQKEDFADDNDAARRQVDTYLDQNVANDRIAAEFRRLLVQAWEEAGGSVKPTDVNVGPLAAPLKDKGLHWQQTDAGPDEEWFTYAWTWQRGPQNHELTFVRVEPEGADPAYLCTTEVSLGLFIDVIEAALQAKLNIPVGNEMLTQESAQDWPGPRTWRLTNNRVIPLTPNPTWVRQGRELFEGGQGDRNYYPQDIVPPQITREHPIQHIPAETALFVARLIGCRLPTSAEWIAAYANNELQVPIENWNLRDQTWQKQNQRIIDALGRGFAYEVWPDEAVFWPLGTEQKDRLEKADAQYLPHDDHTLWFDEVDPQIEGRGREFKHLVGNVAEFIYDEPQRFEEGLPAETMPAFEDIKNFLYDHPDSLYVIGGSALSPPKALQNITEKQSADYSLGYSDVGFRLAFTTPRQSIPQILLRLLQPQS